MWQLSLLLLISVAPVVLGQALCYSDVDCDTPRGYCDLRTSGRCRCGPGFTAWLDRCVPVRQLGQPCEVSPQCRAIEEHAICDPLKAKCDCREGYRRRASGCEFQFEVTAAPSAAEEDDEVNNHLAAILGDASRGGRAEQERLHRVSFIRGLVVTVALTLLTLIVFTAAALVSRRVRQREREEAEQLPHKYAPELATPPPLYSLRVPEPEAGVAPPTYSPNA